MRHWLTKDNHWNAAMSNQPTTTTSHNGEDGKPMKTEGVERASLTDAEADALTAIAHIAVTTVPELQVRRGEANALLNYMSRLERERSELRTALTASEKHMDQLQNGTMLDEFNHDDNSLETLADRCSDAYVAKELRKHVAILKGNT